MLKKIVRKSKQAVKKWAGIETNGQTLTQNINFDPAQKQKKVLVSYIGFDCANRVLASGRTTHSNIPELFKIINCFIEQNYAVDVCDCNYNLSRHDVADRYDLIFGFGEAYKYAKSVNKNAKSIIYMTENPYWYSLKREKQRLDYLYERKGIRENISRTGDFYKENDECGCDAILCLGNPEYLKATGKPLQQLYPTAVKNEYFDFEKKSWDKKVFLSLGSRGFVHKGYDIILEVFEKHPEWTLYLAGYQNLDELAASVKCKVPANVINCGFMDVKSEEFAQLCEKSAAILQFSCSEACSTSILTGMRNALVPVISSGNSDYFCKENCLSAQGDTVEDLEKAILSFTQWSDEKLRDTAADIYRIANEKFNIRQFGVEFEEKIRILCESIK